MFVGHYGVGLAAKQVAPGVPLWVLFIAVQLLDVVWAPLVLLGIEKLRIVPGITATNPLDLYYMPYSHGLIAAVLWSAAASVIYRLAVRGASSTSAVVVAAAVFSHWVLDLVVHRPDLPLYDNTAKVGLGLWDFPVVALALEAAILFVGMWVYFKTTHARKGAMVVFGLGMLALQTYLFFGPPPVSDKAAAATALVAYAVLAAIVRLIEGRGVGAKLAPA